MLSNRTLNFIGQLEKTAAESSSGLQQKKYKITKKYTNHTGQGTALGAALGAATGYHVPSKYRALGIGLGSIAGAGLGRLIGKKSIDKSRSKTQEVNLKREEKKNEGASIPRLNNANSVRYIK